MKKFLDACYFCTTPFQIIGAISLMEQNEENADLYIVGQFPNFKEVARRIEESNVFRKVITIDEYEIIKPIKKAKHKIVSYVLLKAYYFKALDLATKILDDNVFYKKMYFTSQAYIVRLVHLYFLKNKKDMEFILFDDGVGSYFNSDMFKVKFIDKILRTLLFGREACEYNYKKILYEPSLSLRGKDRTNEIIEQMPKLSQKVQELYNYIFDFQKSDTINEEVILFDTIAREIKKNVNQTLLNKAYKMIFDYLGNKLIVKKHPRDKTNGEKGVLYYENNGIPAEVIYINLDVNQKVLIAYNSTAVIMPKFLLNAEPTIVLLYNIVNNSSQKKEIDLFFKNCKELYNDKRKFYIPNNISELEQILKELRKENKM